MPVFSLVLGTKTFIIINSDKAVKELLEKRSRIYSSRPELYLAWTILGSGLRMASMVSTLGPRKNLSLV